MQLYTGDLWAISTSLHFACDETLLAISPMYGVPSSGSLDLQPMVYAAEKSCFVVFLFGFGLNCLPSLVQLDFCD